MFDPKVFMQRVKQANSHYGRFRRSSLHSLVQALERKPFPNPNQIAAELEKLPDASRQKYRAAIDYLTSNMPGLKSAEICRHVGPVKQTCAGARYEWDVRMDLVVHPGLPDTVTVKVYASPTKWDGGAAERSVLVAWKTAIQSAWGGAYKIRPRGDTSAKGRVIRFDLTWTDGSDATHYPLVVAPRQAAIVTQFDRAFLNRARTMQGTQEREAIAQYLDQQTLDMGRWGPDDRQAVLHEFGHMIGCPDEYDLTAYDGGTFGVVYNPAWNAPGYTTDSIMNNPQSKAKIYTRHLTYVRRVYEDWRGLQRDSTEIVRA